MLSLRSGTLTCSISGPRCHLPCYVDFPYQPSLSLQLCLKCSLSNKHLVALLCLYDLYWLSCGYCLVLLREIEREEAGWKICPLLFIFIFIVIFYLLYLHAHILLFLLFLLCLSSSVCFAFWENVIKTFFKKKKKKINRTQRVRVNGILSDQMYTLTGSPQGCVLSPLLFILYTNVPEQT